MIRFVIIRTMIDLMTVVMLAVFGLFLGSFAGATVWRLRGRQLVEDSAAGEKVDKQELKRLKPLTASSVRTDRSQCLHCKHRLAWYDLVPLFSWLQLRGRCRYCKKSIGWFEPVIELATAAFFVISYLGWPSPLITPLELASFVVWLAVGTGLIILFCYDAKWFLLPDKIVFPLLGLAAISATLQITSSAEPLMAFWSAIGACMILSGLYYLLYLISKGAWIGFGDIKLGLVLGLMLADWQLALLALFLANVIGCLVVLPAMVSKRLSRYSHVPFGPMLIAGFWIAGLFGHELIAWYLKISFSFL